MSRSWLLLVAVLAAATALAAALGLFWRADLALYDAGLPRGAAPRDVVIIAIDDRSLKALGRWPWRRAVHARLLDRLRDAEVAGVALDLVMSEADTAHPGDDAALAAALARGPPSVLPLLADFPEHGGRARTLEPTTALAHAASALGHVNLELDRDGIARRVYLREGPGAPDYPHLMLALLSVVDDAIVDDPQAPQPFGVRHPGGTQDRTAWVRDYQLLIPYLGPPGHFQHYSYVDVLEGVIPGDQLRGKLVLVGATAQGLSDEYPTPRSGASRAMPGIEICANLLQALRTRTWIRETPRALVAATAPLPLVLACLLFLWRTPRQSLFWLVGIGIGVLLACFVALRLAHWWWPPAATLASLLVIYPLWSWWRLNATQRYVEAELERFSAEHTLFGSTRQGSRTSPRFADTLQRRIELLRGAAERVRDSHKLMAVTVRSLPDATLITDCAGRIILANTSAAALFGATDEAELEEHVLDELLRGFDGRERHTHQQIFDSAPCVFEARFAPARKDLLVRAEPFIVGPHTRLGTLLSLADITDLRTMQREREDVIRFLSHDMKGPASSLLALAQLQRTPDKALPAPELATRFEALAQRTLGMLEGFTALAQAESVDTVAFTTVDCRDVVQDASDEVWAQLESRGMRLDSDVAAQPLQVHGDRRLLARALANLLGNAAKYAPGHSTIRLRCGAGAGGVQIMVEDQGSGVPAEYRGALFQRFSRAQHAAGHASGKAPRGAGLGLAFVRVVAEKHHGEIRYESAPGGGARFVLQLPSASAS